MSANAGDGDSNPDLEKTFFEKRFHRLAQSDINSDCEFIVGSKKAIIKGHKLIFSAASDVFQAMFYGQLKQDAPVKVEDLSAEGFEGMKTFIYTGDISFTSAINALLTYIAARKYLVPQLGNVCTKFIEEKLRPLEVLEFYEICLCNMVTEFVGLCSRIIQEKTDEVVESEYFILAESDTIELILKLPSLKLSSEIELFDHFERWALAEVERRQISSSEIATSFNHLKKHIRFLTVNGDEFVSRIGETVLLTHEEKRVIAFNQINLGLLSKPVPDSISLIQQSRDFKLLQSGYHQSSRKFIVPIDKDNSSTTYYTMKIPDPSINCCYIFIIHWKYENGFITFKLDTILTYYKNRNALFVIKSKFRVLADNKRDDLVFEENVIWKVPDTSSSVSNLQIIPVKELQQTRFLKSFSDQVINIEGAFKIRIILHN